MFSMRDTMGKDTSPCCYMTVFTCSTAPPIPPIVITADKSSFQLFFRRRKHQQTCSNSSSIYSLNINGRLYWGPIFDANGQQIN